MTLIKGQYLQRIMDKRRSARPLCQKFRPFIEVIKYESDNIISIIKTGFFY